MPIFTYKAKNADEVEYEGSFNAPDKFTLFKHIKEEGGEVLSYQEKRVFQKLSIEKLNIFFSRINEQAKIDLARNLGVMLKSGLALSRALEVMERQTKNLALKKTLKKIQDTVSGGGTLHDALGEFPAVFSSLFVAMVRSGEESGNLSESLSVISEQMDQSFQLKKKVKGAMMYPSIILIVMVIIGIAMLVYVVPTLSSTFRELNVDLPASTRAIIATSDFLRLNSLTALMLITTVLAGLYYSLKTGPGKRVSEFILLHAPIVGPLIKETNSARMSRTLSSLLSSGVPIVRALEITADVIQNTYFKNVVVEAQKKVEKGAVMSEVFREAERLYPPFVSEMTSVGEETGNISEMLTRVAEYYEAEVARKTKDMSTIIEPVLMVVIGAGVGFFAISMIQPIYSLSSAI